MLLELGIGDAYGAAFEYVNASIVEGHNDGLHYHKHPRHEAPVGWYTDDTQMSLAIAEAIISGDNWTPLMLANRFVDVFQRDPRTGYAHGFHALLSRVSNGQELLDLIMPDSDKSGAAMRAAPCGVYPTITEVIEKTTVQARVTHDTPDGIRGAARSSPKAG
jgi:ADP-ribosyl-[dinitrogen reductase] hydrolase